ncbi:unnamed protein product, partial [Laminaria digitata]
AAAPSRPQASPRNAQQQPTSCIVCDFQLGSVKSHELVLPRPGVVVNKSRYQSDESRASLLEGTIMPCSCCSPDGVHLPRRPRERRGAPKSSSSSSAVEGNGTSCGGSARRGF